MYFIYRKLLLAVTKFCGFYQITNICKKFVHAPVNNRLIKVILKMIENACDQTLIHQTSVVSREVREECWQCRVS